MRMFAEAAALATLLLACGGWARGAEIAPASFPLASVHFEQNATDGDVEVVFQVKGGKDGLAQLTVASPQGRRVVDFRAPDASTTLGIRQFRFESPEPTDTRSLKTAYPEGVYVFSGTTVSGARFAGKSTLSHRLPATTAVLRPAAQGANVPAKDLKVEWNVVRGVASYLVGIKQPESNVNVTARVPASATSFAVPDGILLPGKKYKLSIGTVAADGNTSFVEMTFTTAN